MCRAPVACFGSVYVHVAAVIAACIVCIVLFILYCIVCDCDNQMMSTEEHRQNQCQDKERVHRGIDCKEEEEGKGSIEVWCT